MFARAPRSRASTRTAMSMILKSIAPGTTLLRHMMFGA